MYKIYISKKAEKIIKDVNATMSLEGMPLSEVNNSFSTCCFFARMEHLKVKSEKVK